MLGGKGLERQTSPHRFQAVISPPTERPWASGSFSAVWGGPGSRAGCWQAWSCVYTVSARMGGMVTSALNVPALYGQRLLVYSQSHQIIGARVCLFPSSNVCPFQLSSADRPPPALQEAQRLPTSLPDARRAGWGHLCLKERQIFVREAHVCLPLGDVPVGAQRCCWRPGACWGPHCDRRSRATSCGPIVAMHVPRCVLPMDTAGVGFRNGRWVPACGAHRPHRGGKCGDSWVGTGIGLCPRPSDEATGQPCAPGSWCCPRQALVIPQRKGNRGLEAPARHPAGSPPLCRLHPG